MLTIFGRKTKFCDGVSRRDFLQIGAFTFGAASLSLTDIFRAEARAGVRTSQHKAVINIFLGGGPPHQDMWDLKMDAPVEIRGEFKPIGTKVPGIQICEVFPRIAARMDKFVPIRSVVGARGGHDAVQCMSGWPEQSMAAMGGRPSLGAAVSKLQGPVDPSVPPFVGLAVRTQHMPWSDCGRPGFLGTPCAAFKPDGPGMANLTLRGMTTAQLAERHKLLTSFDNLRQEIDASGTVRGIDAMQERALGVLTSSKLLEALDLSRENDKVRWRDGDGKPYQFQYDVLRR